VVERNQFIKVTIALPRNWISKQDSTPLFIDSAFLQHIRHVQVSEI
jgi:hypothetical protein